MRLLRTTVTAKSNPAQVFSGAQHSDKVLAETSDPAAESHVAPVEPGDSAERCLVAQFPPGVDGAYFQTNPENPKLQT